jgi:hypothetical protein
MPLLGVFLAARSPGQNGVTTRLGAWFKGVFHAAPAVPLVGFRCTRSAAADHDRTFRAAGRPANRSSTTTDWLDYSKNQQDMVVFERQAGLRLGRYRQRRSQPQGASPLNRIHARAAPVISR